MHPRLFPRTTLFVFGLVLCATCTSEPHSSKDESFPIGESLPAPVANCDTTDESVTAVIQERIEATQTSATEARNELMNPETITVVTCGTGTPMRAVRAQSCTAVFVNGTFLLFDAGAGAQRSMENLIFPIAELDALFLTHFHSDHIADVGEVISRSWLRGRRAPLTIYGGKGISRIVEGFSQVYALDNHYRSAHHGEELFPQNSLAAVAKLVEEPNSNGRVIYEKNSVTVTAFKVNHPPVEPALGYRIDYAGKSVVISGDTAETEALKTMSQGANILVSDVLSRDLVEAAECGSKQLGNQSNMKIFQDIRTYHIDVNALGRTAADAQVDTLVLTHMVPDMDNEAGIAAFFTSPLALLFSGEIIAAEDGTRIVLPVP